MTLKSCPVGIGKRVTDGSRWNLPKLAAFFVFSRDQEFSFLVRHFAINFLHLRTDPLLQEVFRIFIGVLPVVLLENIDGSLSMSGCESFGLYFLSCNIQSHFFSDSTSERLRSGLSFWIGFSGQFCPNKISHNGFIRSKIVCTFYRLWFRISKNTEPFGRSTTLSCLSVRA